MIGLVILLGISILSAIVIGGFSLKLKDKRVDNILSNKGHEKYVIYYSPLKMWFIFLGIFFLPIISFVFFFFNSLILENKIEFLLFLFLFFLVGYFMSSYLNNNFVLTKDKLIVINPNFPFRKNETFKLSEIQSIEINKDKTWLFSVLFGVYGGNYVKIFELNKTKKFYCYNLEIDCYDENWTEKTLNDLANDLIERGIKTNLKI